MAAMRVRWERTGRAVGRSRASVEYHSALRRSWVKGNQGEQFRRSGSGWVAGAKAERGPAGTRHFPPHQGMQHQLVQGLNYLSSAW